EKIENGKEENGDLPEANIISPSQIPDPGSGINDPQPDALNVSNDLNDSNDTMEVHKHPHHVAHKKKWGEYVLEFLMLFLAVFLGFIAENIREHYVEHQREKEYISSLVRDLEKDTAQLHQCIKANLVKKDNYASLWTMLKRPDPFENIDSLYY